MKRIIDIDEKWYLNIIASKDLIDKDDEAYLILNSKPYEERPHGHWISANNTYYCSCCKHYAYESQKFDFCQDCGARMQSDLDGFGVSGY